VRASLLRAPRYPDPETDQGVHRFRHALVPGATIADAVREGYRANLPEHRLTGAVAAVAPLVTVDEDAVVVSAVKLADDRGGDLVVRLYEANGGRAHATVSVADGFVVDRAVLTDLLERPLVDAEALSAEDGTVSLDLRPFQLVTLRIPRA
jgi:alpha-mannosidase